MPSTKLGRPPSDEVQLELALQSQSQSHHHHHEHRPHRQPHQHSHRPAPPPRRRGVDFEAYGAPSPSTDRDRDTEAAPVLQTKAPMRGASIPMLLLLGLPRLTIQMAWSTQWAALGPYLNTMLPKFAVQLAQVIGPVCGILLGPTAGFLSDRCTHPWGRRRPFLVWGSVGTLICWALMAFTKQMGEAMGDHGDRMDEEHTSRNWTAMFMIIFYAWMDITVNIIQTPAFLMIVDFAGDRQVMGASIGQGWANFGSIIISAYIEMWGPVHNHLGYFFAMNGIVMVGSIALVCLVVKEEPLRLDQADANPRMGKHMGDAFYSVIQGLMSLPSMLLVFCIVAFLVMFGFTAYNANKGQFFGIEVYGGSAASADNCNGMCSEAQNAYNRGVKLAGGWVDLGYSILGYLYSWLIPFLVRKHGVKRVLAYSLIPQAFLLIMAFTKDIAFDITIVCLISITQTCLWCLLVPVVVHVFGDQVPIGMYVGALNSANCLGQLLNFIIGAALVESSLGYKLPLFFGGILSFLGLCIVVFLLKIKMFSL